MAEQYASQIAQGYGKDAVKMNDLGKVDRDKLPRKLRILMGDLDASERRK